MGYTYNPVEGILQKKGATAANIKKRWNYTTEDSNSSSFSSDTPQLFVLLNDGTSQRSFNIVDTKGNLDVTNNWYDVSGISNDSTFLVRAEITGSSDMEANLMVRFVPDFGVPGTYFDKYTTNVKVKDEFLYELAFRGFLNEIDAIQIGALTDKNETLTIANVYLEIDEIV